MQNKTQLPWEKPREERLKALNQFIDQLIADDAQGAAEGRWKEGECPWQDIIYGDTGIEIADRDQVEYLSDDELDTILLTYSRYPN